MCFDQLEFITGFTFCTHILHTPINATENAHWPLHGSNNFNLRLETVDAITFTGEFDDKGLRGIIRFKFDFNCK